MTGPAVLADSGSRWACQRREDLSLRTWPQGSVLFDEAQGQLQSLTPVASELMALLLAPRSWSSWELAQSLMGETPTQQDVEMVENVMSHFLSSHLITRLAT